MINKYGLNVSHCMAPQLICMGGVVVKWAPLKEGRCFHIDVSFSSMAFGGYPRSFIMASCLGRSKEPNAFLNSMCVR